MRSRPVDLFFKILSDDLIAASVGDGKISPCLLATRTRATVHNRLVADAGVVTGEHITGTTQIDSDRSTASACGSDEPL
jgi:hypothetical protein